MTFARITGIAVVLVVALLVALFRPACVEIDAETVARFDPPIDQRDDANFYGLATFQQKDGRWHQCKTWIARQLFF